MTLEMFYHFMRGRSYVITYEISQNIPDTWFEVHGNGKEVPFTCRISVKTAQDILNEIAKLR